MDTNNTSRRALLSVAFAAPAAALAASSGLAALPTLTGAVAKRSGTAQAATAWDRAMRAYVAAKRRSDNHDAVLARADAGYQADRPSEDMIDWSEFRFQHRGYVLHTLDLDRYQANIIASEGVTWAGRTEAYRAKRLAAIQSVRDWRALEKQADERHGWNDAAGRADDLIDAACNAAGDLLEMPAPNPTALRWKLEYLFGQDADAGNATQSWNADYVAAVMADARRFLPQEG